MESQIKISVVTPSIRGEGLKVVQECLEQQTFKDFEWLVEMGLPKKDGHDLNRAFNRMLRRAKGELIVFYQDYIKVEPDYLEKLFKAYKENPNTFFTCPVGKTLDWQDVTWDWRNRVDGKIDWLRWEIDSGAAPKDALYKIGGFDEELDKYWSFDNVNVACRADLAGYKFMCLSDIKCIAFDHDATIKHPFRERYNPLEHNYRLDQIRRGEVKVDNLPTS